ncbi:MAG: Uma2 family endonuclease [Pseudomonadota bacterium]
MTGTATKLPPLLTVADFLDWPGDGTGTRYELVDGVLRAMAPGSDVHNTIVANLSGVIWQHLRRNRPGCRLVTSMGVQPRVRAEWNYRVPDLGVTCTEARLGDIFTPDPIVLVEVLSPGNANDTYENVRAYATLPSVSEILIVHSTRVAAELLRRDGAGNWPANPEPIGPGGVIRVASIGQELAIGDVYVGTHLA